MNDDWYVLHVLTGKENDVKGCISKEGFKALAPARKLMERHNGMWKHIVRTLFPGYVFVNTEMTDNNYYMLTEIPGVIDILRGASSSPTPVLFDEMKTVFRLTQDVDLIGISDIFIDGDKIVVCQGPLFGLEGMIVKVDKRRFRAKVKFSIAGDAKIVELGINVISKIV